MMADIDPIPGQGGTWQPDLRTMLGMGVQRQVPSTAPVPLPSPSPAPAPAPAPGVGFGRRVPGYAAGTANVPAQLPPIDYTAGQAPQGPAQGYGVISSPRAPLMATPTVVGGSEQVPPLDYTDTSKQAAPAPAPAPAAAPAPGGGLGDFLQGLFASKAAPEYMGPALKAATPEQIAKWKDTDPLHGAALEAMPTLQGHPATHSLEEFARANQHMTAADFALLTSALPKPLIDPTAKARQTVEDLTMAQGKHSLDLIDAQTKLKKGEQGYIEPNSAAHVKALQDAYNKMREDLITSVVIPGQLQQRVVGNQMYQQGLTQ